METGTFDRSLQQRMDALERANKVRTQRAQFKRRMKAGQASPRSVLSDPPPEFETMKVAALLLAIPKVGRTKTNQWLVRSRISPSKTLGGLSERQRGELLGMMGRYGR